MLHTLRSRLLVLVLALLLPALGLALWALVYTHGAERGAEIRRLRHVHQAFAAGLERELAQLAHTAQLLSDSPLLDRGADTAADDLTRFAALARRALGDPGWVELHGAERRLLSTQPGAAPPPAGPAPLAERAHVGALEPAAAGSGWQARIVQPVQRDGRTVLNLTVVLPSPRLQQLLQTQPLPPGTTAALLDARGRVAAGAPVGDTPVAALPQLLPLLAQAPEARFELPVGDGQRLIGQISRLPAGWLALTARPRSPLAADVQAAALTLGLAALALLAGGLLAARHVAGSIARALQALRQAAGRLQRGQAVDGELHTGIDECDAVARALADASQAVQRRSADTLQRAEQAEARVAAGQRLQTVGRLAAGVAHDFNNLLGVISNATHLMALQRGGEPAGDDTTAMVQRSVASGSRLTGHLLRFAARGPTAPRTVHLTAFLPEVQELLEVVVGRRIRVQTAVIRGVRPVHVDPAELELALLQLALNARDAMPSGGQIWLEARNAEAGEGDDDEGLPPGPCVQLTLTDDGSGIAPEAAARAFEPGFSTRPGAAGLGLSQVRDFCTRAGGSAHLAGTPGIGTCVTLRLPAA